MPRNPSHRNALKPQNMTYEERVENFESKRKKKPQNGIQISKIFTEGDVTLENNMEMMQHGYNIEKKLGRPLCYASVEIFNNEIFEYVRYCTDNKLVPTRPGMALWLGTTSTNLQEWKHNPANPFAESIKKAEELFHEFILQKTINGSINTLLYFFLSKNWFDMSDKTEIVHRSSTSGIDLDEQQRIINSTPGIVIDAQIIDSEPRSENLDMNTTPEDLGSQNANLSVSEDLGTSAATMEAEDLGVENLDDLLLGGTEDLEDHVPEDLGAEDLGAEDLGSLTPEDLGTEDLGTEDLGSLTPENLEDHAPEDLGTEDLGHSTSRSWEDDL